MKKALYAVVAGTLLVSTSAFAFCTVDRVFDRPIGGGEGVTCFETGGNDSGTNNVQRTGALDYQYQVTAQNCESTGGGVLLDFSGSVISGSRNARGTANRGACNQSFSVVNRALDTSPQFFCRNANASLAFIRVFVD